MFWWQQCKKIAFKKMKTKTFFPHFSNIASGMSKQSSQLLQCMSRIYSDLPNCEITFHRIRKKSFKKLSEIKLLQSSKCYFFFPSGQVKNEGFITLMFTEYFFIPEQRTPHRLSQLQKYRGLSISLKRLVKTSKWNGKCIVKIYCFL